MNKLTPRQAVPDLRLSTVDGEPFELATRKPPHFSLLVFYRGVHCPICRPYLRDLDRRLQAFAEHGVEVIALSCDSEERARQAQRDWGLEGLRLAYGLSIEQARAWGLYISSGRGKTSAGIEEPALFCEPGLFLVRPDATLYSASVQTMPFARPRFEDMAAALATIVGRDYPARGEA